MILVRDIFHLKFGKAKEALAMWKDAIRMMGNTPHQPDRVLTDLTGEYYTLIMESTFDNLTDYENGMKGEMQTDEWRKWSQKFTELVIDGRREIFNIVQVTEHAKVYAEKAYASTPR